MPNESLINSLGFESTPLHEQTENNQRTALLALLRFLPLSEVNEYIQNYQCDESTKKTLEVLYGTVKTDYNRIAPYCSRYSTQQELYSLNNSYQIKHEPSCMGYYASIALSDYTYGVKRAELAKNLVGLLQSDGTLSPKHKQFEEKLQPSSIGTRRVAYIVEEIAKVISQDRREHEDYKSESFQVIRSTFGRTQIANRYKFGLSLVKSVLYHSSLPEIYKLRKSLTKQDSLDMLFQNNRDGTYNGFSYPLYYEDSQQNPHSLTDVLFSPEWPFFDYEPYGPVSEYWCHHGLVSVSSAVWSDIEDLFEAIWRMEVTTEADKSLFYKSVAKLVWLIGNFQPLERGSGSVAEVILGIVHIHHGLQPPILKLDYPQLGVLDISFPLADYQFLFPYFFEPESIPQYLREGDESLKGLPISAQLVILYQKLNATPERQAMIEEQECLAADIAWIDQTCDVLICRLEQEQEQFLARRNLTNEASLNTNDAARYAVLSTLIENIVSAKATALRDREDDVENWKINLQASLTEHTQAALDDVAIEKYSDTAKLLIRILNIICQAFTTCIPVGRLSLFSVHGRPKEAVLDIVSSLQDGGARIS